MHRHAESPEKPVLQAADVIEHLLSAVNSIALSSELTADEQDRVKQSLLTTMKIVETSAVTAGEQHHEHSERHVPTVAENDASADE